MAKPVSSIVWNGDINGDGFKDQLHRTSLNGGEYLYKVHYGDGQGNFKTQEELMRAAATREQYCALEKPLAYHIIWKKTAIPAHAESLKIEVGMQALSENVYNNPQECIIIRFVDSYQGRQDDAEKIAETLIRGVFQCRALGPDTSAGRESTITDIEILSQTKKNACGRDQRALKLPVDIVKVSDL